MVNKCIVDSSGQIVEILQKDRSANISEFKVDISGYYECLNEQMYDNAVWNFEEKKWVGVGIKRKEQSQCEDEQISLKRRIEITEATLLQILLDKEV